jgi:hypothetical protein
MRKAQEDISAKPAKLISKDLNIAKNLENDNSWIQATFPIKLGLGLRDVNKLYYPALLGTLLINYPYLYFQNQQV